MVLQRRYVIACLAGLLVMGLGNLSSAYASGCCSAGAGHGGMDMADAKGGHAGMDMTDTKGDPAAKDATAKQGKEITVTGSNFCTFCQVTTKESAMAECQKKGHRMAVKVKEAKDLEGTSLPQLKGQVLSYTKNDNAKTLADPEHYNKTVTVTGVLTGKRSLNVTQVGPVGEPSVKPEAGDKAQAPGKNVASVKLPTTTPEAAKAFLDSLAPGVAYYTCSMHAQVVSDKPGACPLCNMALVERHKG